MTRPSRRSLLCGTASIVALSAGCLGSLENSPDDESPSDGTEDDPGNPDDGSDDSQQLPAGLADYQTEAYHLPTESAEPTIRVLQDTESAADWLDERGSLRDDGAVETLVDETDFETSVLISLEATAPNPCYELVLESLDIDEDDDSSAGETGGTAGAESTGDGDGSNGGDDGSDADDELVLEGVVRDTSAEDDACIQSIVTVGRLVRVTFESAPLTTISATIVDHHGNTYGASMSSDSASASESTSVDSGRGTGTDSQSDGS